MNNHKPLTEQILDDIGAAAEIKAELQIHDYYEKTLQKKDKQIRVLTRALQRIATLEQSDPRRGKLAMARGIAKAAIKGLS